MVRRTWLQGGCAWFGEVVWRDGTFGEACFRSGRVGESSGWLGSNQKDGLEMQVSFAYGALSGSGTAFASCSSQGLPVLSRNVSQWCRVCKRPGEAQACKRDVVAYCIWVPQKVRLTVQEKETQRQLCRLPSAWLWSERGYWGGEELWVALRVECGFGRWCVWVLRVVHGESARLLGGRCGEGEDGLRKMRVR